MGSRTGKGLAGFIIGAFFGLLAVIVTILKESPSEFHNEPKWPYLIIILIPGVIGAIFGDKALEKISDWLSWF